MSELARPTIAIPEDLLARFDKKIGARYANRSDAVRELMAEALREDASATAKGNARMAHGLLQLIIEEGNRQDMDRITGALATFVEAIRSRK